MKRFASLCAELQATHQEQAQIEALIRYFREAAPADAAWAVFLFQGKKLKKRIPGRELRLWARDLSGLPDWLFELSLSESGNLAETLVLLTQGQDPPPGSDTAPAQEQLSLLDGAPPELPGASLREWLERWLIPLLQNPGPQTRSLLTGAWRVLDPSRRSLLLQLLGGRLDLELAPEVLAVSLARFAELPTRAIQWRLEGKESPSEAFFEKLVSRDNRESDPSRAYPFQSASPLLIEEPSGLGPRSDWQVEWDWPGIRAQLIRRQGQSLIWSRDDKLLNSRFKELLEALSSLPDGTVLEGWILERSPAVFVAQDLLEQHGQDLSPLPLRERRARLEEALGNWSRSQPGAPLALELNPTLGGATWAEVVEIRQQARSRGARGILLKPLDSPARASASGSGSWKEWKIEPLTLDAVLVYAQSRPGRRGGAPTEYTFAVWDAPEEGPRQLVAVVKADSGLTARHATELERWIRDHTVQRFGPVRSVQASRVFEIAFESIAPSARHRSGLIVRGARIVRERTDKTAAEADPLQRLQKLAIPAG